MSDNKAQRTDAIDVLGEEFAELVDELEAIIAGIGKAHGRQMLLKSARTGAGWWLALAKEARWTSIPS